ncbi:MAG: hypothetical protein U9Q63_02655, partial [Patescibacteria group bacterium]|nr:hypothetical protein [Patescibacteria group bacterium]
DFLGFEKTAGEGVNIDGTFSFRSQLHLSKERLIQKDNGYYSYAKVKKIEEILTDEGVDATFSKKREGRSVITIEKDGQYIEVNFHFPSKKAEEVSIRKMTEEDGELYYFQVQKREKHISEKIKEVTRENFISLMLVNKNMAETDVEGYPKLEDETGFCKAIATYAEVYEEVINAIYQEAGITPPGDSITLKPPVAIKE